MNRAVTPKQLELIAGKTREELILATAPQVDRNSLELDANSGKLSNIETVTDEGDFDWNTDDAVILKEQRATAVYHNKMGELIIRQRAAWDDEQDTFVYVAPENVTAFLEAAAKKARE